MKILSKNIKWAGNFLNLHHYYLDTGRFYEVCSRKEHPNPKECDAVDIIAFNADKSKVCVISEYRIPVEGYCLAFPAGLREPGEEIYETACRELFEECGLHIISLIKTLEPSYQSPGMTDENVATVICVADGELSNKNNTEDEQIYPLWLSKDEAKVYLELGKPISARCQMFLAMWSGYMG